MSMLDRGEKVLNRFVGTCVCGFEGLILLVSDDASSSIVEWRSNLLTCVSGEGEGVSGDGDVTLESSGHDCVAVVSEFVSITSGGTPLLAPKFSVILGVLTFLVLGDGSWNFRFGRFNRTSRHSCRLGSAVTPLRSR
jgi:hypothetical protein